MFAVGDKVVHPMHGAGVIDSITAERVNGEMVQLYVFQMPVSGLTLKIPTEKSDLVGLRSISAPEEIESVFARVHTLGTSMTANWNHRYRENMERLKSGKLLEVAGVIKALMFRDEERGLSTGERKMLHTAKQIMLSEIVLSKNITYAEAEEDLNRVIMAKEPV